MDWNNIDLKNQYERSQNIIDSLSFETILLEISCNVQDINASTVMAQFEADLQIRVKSARDVMRANLQNIVNDALEYRNDG